MSLIGKLVGKLVTKGSLTLHTPGRAPETFGPGGGKHLTVRFTDKKVAFDIIRNPRLGFGETYMGSPAALLAVFATPLSLGAMKQMRILRIDHHGWQIVLALVAMLAVLDERPRRSGLVAGAAMAFWCNISIEALPFVAALGAWFAFHWLRDASAGERLKSYLTGLASASLLLFGLTHAPSVWFDHPHDALNIAHLVGFGVAALGSHGQTRRASGDCVPSHSRSRGSARPCPT